MVEQEIINMYYEAIDKLKQNELNQNLENENQEWRDKIEDINSMIDKRIEKNYLKMEKF